FVIVVWQRSGSLLLLDVDVPDRAGLEALLEPPERIAIAGVFAEQQREEGGPLIARDALVHGDGADPVACEGVGQEGERDVVGQVESEARVVEEDEVTDEPKLDSVLALRDAAGHEVQFVQRLLYGGVFQRVEPERLRRGVERREQRHALRLECAAALDQRRRRHRAHDACASRRSARDTALRTTASGSLAARSSAARAAGVFTRPSASAAHARRSDGARRPKKPRPLRMPSSRRTLSGPPTVP